MAKGRRLTASRSERLLGSYGYGHGHSYGGGANGTTEVSELVEEDIWTIVDESHDDEIHHHHQINGQHSEWNSRASSEINGGSYNNNNNSSSSGMTIKPRRRVPTREDPHQAGGLSLAFEDSSKTSSPRIVQQFRSHDSVASSPRGGGGRQMATSAPMNVPDWRKILRVDSIESMHDSEDWLDERDSEMVPPHEYLARSGKTGGTTTSVFEGVGRTLKGRDMSRVRDAVWSQTGFDG